VAKGKKAKARRPAPTPREPKAVAPLVPRDKTPLFCFRYADTGTKNPWRFGADRDSTDIVDFLTAIAQSTWSEITAMQTGAIRRHRKHHEMDVSQIVSGAQADLNRKHLGEVFGDQIFRFRLSGEKRLWGFRDDRTFHIVWWDPEHQVYPTEKG
jgi:hypothetical protein